MTELETIKEQLVKQGFDSSLFAISEFHNSIAYKHFVFYRYGDGIACEFRLCEEKHCYKIVEKNDTPETITERFLEDCVEYVRRKERWCDTTPAVEIKIKESK